MGGEFVSSAMFARANKTLLSRSTEFVKLIFPFTCGSREGKISAIPFGSIEPRN